MNIEKVDKVDTLFLNDRAELSFVEVLMIEYQPGDKWYSGYFENEVSLFDTDWEDCTEDINDPNHGPDLLITKPLTAFLFKCVGTGDWDISYSSSIEYEAYMLSYADVFENWIDELKEVSKDIPYGPGPKGWDGGKIKRFVTLWSFISWEDTYNHEWDAEWNLLGVVDPYKIKDLVVGEIKE